jgi:hypothetical protein
VPPPITLECITKGCYLPVRYFAIAPNNLHRRKPQWLTSKRQPTPGSFAIV